MKVGIALERRSDITQTCRAEYQNTGGAIGSHSRHAIKFNDFLDLAETGGESDARSLYLAQAPIWTAQSSSTRSTLSCLQEDIDIPTWLPGKRMSAINLWMSIGEHPESSSSPKTLNTTQNPKRPTD
eukprot:1184110-Prorocentrum_minimum.AAC.5